MSNVGSLMQFLCNKSICRRIVKKTLWVADLDWTDSIFTVVALFGRPYIIVSNVLSSVSPFAGVVLDDMPLNTRRILVLCALDCRVPFSSPLNGTTDIIGEWLY